MIGADTVNTTPFLTDVTEREPDASTLSDEDWAALMQFQEQANSLAAYWQLVQELGISADAPLDELKAALADYDITVAEATDWLPACNYDLTCFNSTMHQELYDGRQRMKAKRAVRLAVGGAVLVVGLGLWWWKHR